MKTNNRNLSTTHTQNLNSPVLETFPEQTITKSSLQGDSSQMTFDDISDGPVFTQRKVALSFVDSKRLPIHRWYPYVEGFSAGYAAHVIETYSKGLRAIYDPFGGAGTTQLEASLHGIASVYCEVNPFMAFVANTKTNVVRRLRGKPSILKDSITRYIEYLHSPQLELDAGLVSLDAYKQAFPQRDFFEEQHIRNILGAREAIKIHTEDADVADLLLLAIASIAVDASNMTRRADLRRRRPDEYKNRKVDVPDMLVSKLQEMYDDVLGVEDGMIQTRKVGDDAMNLATDYNNSFDLALTSPPYLNGTNYFRNTKIELWLTGRISHESDLSTFTTQAVTSGINNVSKRRKDIEAQPLTPEIGQVVAALNAQAYDVRIPKLVQSYFDDMYRVLSCAYNSLRDGATLVLDMGDSKFAGVHVATDKLLIGVAEKIGYQLEASNLLAKRYSRDKTDLVQVELLLVKSTQRTNIAVNIPNVDNIVTERIITPEQRLHKAAKFQRTLPYKTKPYSDRNWGHELHSLCCYQGKFKPALAHWLVREFTEPGMTVLDPLGGVGTIALEACLQGRRGITSDMSPFASVVGKAKVAPPPLDTVLAGADELERELANIVLTEQDFEAAEFGLNARVCDYYHETTLREILKARRYYLGKQDMSQTDCLLKASVLHILHGNRPYALSRMSHPITPFNPSGPFEYRSLMHRLRQRVQRSYSQSLPTGFMSGEGFQADFRDLPAMELHPADCIITSPPFIGMRFDRPNWLRLWFCGWEANDFHKTSLKFLERQQSAQKMDVYSEFFEVAARLLKVNGFMLVHVGGSKKYDMSTALARCAEPWFQLAATIKENVEIVEKHGIRDKGTTTSHEVILLERNVA